MIILLEDNGGGLTMCNVQNSWLTEAVSGLEFCPNGTGIQDMYDAHNDGMSDWITGDLCYFNQTGNSHNFGPMGEIDDKGTMRCHVITTLEIWNDYIHGGYNRVAELNENNDIILYLSNAGHAAWKYLTGGYKPCP